MQEKQPYVLLFLCPGCSKIPDRHTVAITYRGEQAPTGQETCDGSVRLKFTAIAAGEPLEEILAVLKCTHAQEREKT